MNIFNLFRKKETIPEATIPPSEEPLSVSIGITAGKSVLAAFLLDRDYEAIGKQEGYLHPVAEVMERSLRKLQSQFREAVDRMIDEKRSDLNTLKLHLINTRGLGDDIQNCIKEKISQLENLAAVLDSEKILSIEGEGKIASVLQAYRCGFRKGVAQYNDEKFIAHSTNLF